MGCGASKSLPSAERPSGAPFKPGTTPEEAKAGAVPTLTRPGVHFAAQEDVKAVEQRASSEPEDAAEADLKGTPSEQPGIKRGRTATGPGPMGLGKAYDLSLDDDDDDDDDDEIDATAAPRLSARDASIALGGGVDEADEEVAAGASGAGDGKQDTRQPGESSSTDAPQLAEASSTFAHAASSLLDEPTSASKPPASEPSASDPPPSEPVATGVESSSTGAPQLAEASSTFAHAASSLLDEPTSASKPPASEPPASDPPPSEPVATGVESSSTGAPQLAEASSTFAHAASSLLDEPTSASKPPASEPPASDPPSSEPVATGVAPEEVANASGAGSADAPAADG
ncbi:hypothetical protein KFE25_001309 [Diacronema lutheri]|uniref:Uncharacterized protein n=1 Tax=Diacronema lutheri TaxID=2081491 RepID=A0A8J6C884_DIALT|nr:hypothetical protein KFE25_001309 [Diacronema lutheri]